MSVCFLRKRIEETLRKKSNSEQTALAICLLLENEIGLYGNGWFNGDDVLLKKIGAE